MGSFFRGAVPQVGDDAQRASSIQSTCFSEDTEALTVTGNEALIHVTRKLAGEAVRLEKVNLPSNMRGKVCC